MIKDKTPVVSDIMSAVGIPSSVLPSGDDKRPTVIIIFGDNNMPSVELKNWVGINAMMIERATHEIHRASHIHRAGELHKQNVENLKKENENV